MCGATDIIVEVCPVYGPILPAMRLVPTCLLILLAGCHVVPTGPDYGGVSARLLGRQGTALSPEPPPRTVFLPNGAALDQALTEEEAVLIAVWNNAAFRELLT